MQNDRQITISTATSRAALNWLPQTLWWSEFIEKLRVPVKSPETLKAYFALPKGEQNELKDVGGFVGGELSGRRKAGNLKGRGLITLDLDQIPPGATDDVLRRLSGLGCAFAVYSTRKHEPEAPRLRVIAPTDRTVLPEEYQPIARKLAEIIGITLCDPTTFEAHRLMYWPSVCHDSQYVFIYEDKPFLDADGMLALYKNWRDTTEWPEAPGEKRLRDQSAKRQTDPVTKSGIVGAFCRCYDVFRAMEDLIPGVYTPTNVPGRYSFAAGSTAGGATVYDEGRYLYSHHATDPASGQLVNAFDLVRLHKYGHLDDETKSDPPANRLPSYTAMCAFALNDDNVRNLMTAEDFATVNEQERDWTKQLTRDEKGHFHKTLNNIMLLVQNAPELNGCARKDDFSGRICAADGLPWRAEKGYWTDADTTELRKHFETRYKGFKPGKQDIRDAVIASAVRQKFHPVRDYLNALLWDGQPRLDTLFVDYLGVADSTYTRAVTRKALVAAVARVMSPGCKFDNMLVFVGKQGRGKSSIIYKLAGGDRGDEWFADSLVTFDGNRAFEAVAGKWLVEVPEMHAFDQADLNQAKAFISKQSDFYRAAYAEFPEDRRRQCVFFGTTNNAECLRDETGGRRFWPLDIDAVARKKNHFTGLAAELDQIWAEAVMYWKLGEPLHLPKELETTAEERQEAHREAHPWEDTIKNFIDREIPEDWDDWDLDRRMLFWSGSVAGEIALAPREKVCVREIWQEALMMGIAALDQRKARAIAGIVNRLDSWEKNSCIRFGKEYGRQRGYVRKVMASTE